MLSLAALGFAGCQQFKKGDGDLLYKIHTDKDGPAIKIGDFVAFKAIEKTEEDSVLYSSYDFDRPSLIVEEKSLFKGDMYAALALLSEGDSATFKINIDSMEKKMGRPKPKNTKGKYLVYNIKIDKVIPKGQLNDSLFRGKIDEFLKTEMDHAKATEGKKLSDYIAAKNLKPSITASGLKYVVTQQGNGPKAVAGDTVEVNYTGSFLSGKIFDTSLPEAAKKAGIFNQMRPYAPIKVAAGVNGTIPGFDEALLLFGKGTKVSLILPSSLAYGAQGNQAIPPYTPLLFDLEFVNIIPAKAGAAAAVTPAAPPAAAPKK